MPQGAVRMSGIGLVAAALAVFVNAHPAAATYIAPHQERPAASTSGALWGIDTVDNVETGNIIAQTITDLGAPQFVGRYLVYSSELSKAEAQYIHQAGTVDPSHRRPEPRLHIGNHRRRAGDRAGKVTRGRTWGRDLPRRRDQRPDFGDVHRRLRRRIRGIGIRHGVLRKSHQRLVRRCVLLAGREQSRSGQRCPALLQRAGAHGQQPSALCAPALRTQRAGLREPHGSVAVPGAGPLSLRDMAKCRRRRAAGALCERALGLS
jgi:hypothetical protein